MSTIVAAEQPAPSHGGAQTSAVDRWFFVGMAAWYILIVLVGFIPDSLMKIAAVDAGQRAPFPPILHVHAVLMGAFLLLLLTQATLVAIGRRDLHQRLGVVGAVLAAALVVVGFILVPTMHQQLAEGLRTAPPPAREAMLQGQNFAQNIMLVQIRAGLLFAVFVTTALLARRRDSSLHKRLMFLAVAIPLPAALDRMTWLPSTLPASPLTPDLYTLAAVSPMFIWDLMRTRKVHAAYLIWLAGMIPTSIVINLLWNTPWWRETAMRLVGL